MNRKRMVCIIISIIICFLGTAVQAQSSGTVKLDSDGDGILDDGDSSGVAGDNKCIGGEAEDCDDNCRFISNPDQADEDEDGFGNVCDFMCGDMNMDSAINILDITTFISHMWIGPNPPILMDSTANTLDITTFTGNLWIGWVPPIPEIWDVNNNGTINILDLTYLISFLYKDGPDLNCPEILKNYHEKKMPVGGEL